MATYDLKNTTASALEIDDMGITIQASGLYEGSKIPTDAIARSFIDGQLGPLASAGTVVLVTSTGQLSASETNAAFNRLFDGDLSQHIETIITDTGSLNVDDKVGKVLTFAGINGVGTSASGLTIGFDSSGNASNATPAAQMFELTFTHLSSIGDDWLQTSGTPSNETPLLVPWDAKLVGLTYSNKEEGSDIDIEIYKVAENVGASPITLEFTWDLDDARVARKTSFSPAFAVFAKGDKIAVFARSVVGGVDPSNVRIIMHFIVIAFDETENIENYLDHIFLPP